MNKWQKLGFRKPQNKIEWTLWIGAGFILLAIIWSLLFVKKPAEFTPQIFTALYITHFLKDIGLGIIATAILLGGFIRLKKDEKKTRGYIGTIGGIFLFLFMIGKPAISTTMLSTLHADTYKFSNLLIEKQTEKATNPHLPEVDKAYFRKAVAQEKYFQDGSLAEYQDENGHSTKYQPTAEDVRKGEQFLIMSRTIRILRIEMIFWILAFVATFTGAIIYNKKEPKD